MHLLSYKSKLKDFWRILNINYMQKFIKFIILIFYQIHYYSYYPIFFSIILQHHFIGRNSILLSRYLKNTVGYIYFSCMNFGIPDYFKSLQLSFSSETTLLNCQEIICVFKFILTFIPLFSFSYFTWPALCSFAVAFSYIIPVQGSKPMKLLWINAFELPISSLPIPRIKNLETRKTLTTN